MNAFTFSIQARDKKSRARAGVVTTPHGSFETPCFVVVGTKATVKSVTSEMLKEAGAAIALANTYHLYLQPGDDVVRAAGGVGKFMHWDGPTMTDSGGFQVFSLGAAYGHAVSKVSREELDADTVTPSVYDADIATQHGKLAIIDDEGVSFTSHIDGSLHRFTPERSIEIQHNLGADIIVAFDECTGATASYDYQKEAMHRTHRWAERSLYAHKQNIDAANKQALFGVVQGGRYEDLRRESARFLADKNFDGFGIGGSYIKEDLDTAVGWVCEELPDDKPRHLLGIGEPQDLINGIAKGVDMFDCVIPTRYGRTGTVFTREGKISLRKEQYARNFSAIDDGCECYTCKNYTRAYLAHLFRADEMLGATLASVHNLYFLISLVRNAREAILDGS